MKSKKLKTFVRWALVLQSFPIIAAELIFCLPRIVLEVSFTTLIAGALIGLIKLTEPK